MIKNIGLFIKAYNTGEDLQKARIHIEECGLSCYTDESVLFSAIAKTGGIAAENAAHPGNRDTFIFTDDRQTADRASALGIGFAVYDNAISKMSSFPDALYLVEQVTALPADQIDRMLLRFLHLPWTILETERCIVREITVEDVDALYEMYRPADAFRYTEGLFEDPAEERAYTRDYIENQYKFCEYGIWIVTEKQSGRIIGRAGISNREGYEDAELGFAFAPAYRHQGYAAEVCTAILSYAENMLGMDVINAFTIHENTECVNLLTRLGFRYVSTADIRGGVHDLYRRISSTNGL
ncbi:MAG: GNAT family N-acetyltransferase [Lachnospiraceae bacterium]|nr:GNAT family N-acetyltransferase [Lachnospiraceae bacterium]